MRLGLLLAAVAGTLLGCGTRTSYTQLNAPPTAMNPRDPASVEVFTAARPERPYVEVGIIEAQQRSEFSADDMPEIVAELRARAADEGCDAVFINSNNDAVVGSTNEGSGSTSTLKGFRGACLVYKPDAPAAAPAAPAPAAAPAAPAPAAAPAVPAVPAAPANPAAVPQPEGAASGE